MALPRRVAVGSTRGSATGTAAVRRVTGTWSQPEPWTVAVLLLTGAVIIGRHPLARMIGTEAHGTATSTTVVTPAPAVPVGVTAGGAAAAALQAVPTHAPRDPFRALVSAGGAVLAPDAAAPGVSTAGHHHSTPSTTPAQPGVGAATCAGTVHTVVQGDTLWTIAARAVKSSDTGTVTVAWHRIYRANRPPLSDPSLLAVGTKLCLPTSI